MLHEKKISNEIEINSFKIRINVQRVVQGVWVGQGTLESVWDHGSSRSDPDSDNNWSGCRLRYFLQFQKSIS